MKHNFLTHIKYLYAAIERWKFAHTTTANPNPKPNLAQYDEIWEEW